MLSTMLHTPFAQQPFHPAVVVCSDFNTLSCMQAKLYCEVLGSEDHAKEFMIADDIVDQMR